MNPIPVTSSTSPRHRHAHEQRKQLNEIIFQLVESWQDRADDPLAVEMLRGLALAQSIDDTHPIDHQGRCTRWRCARRWLFIRRRCPTRVILEFCRTTDTVTLWFHVLNQLPHVHLSLAAVRAWITQSHTGKPETETDEPPATPSAVN